QALTRQPGVAVVPGAAPSHLDAAAIRALAAQTGAGTVVLGTYYRDGDSVRFHVQIIDAARGTVLRGVEPVGAPRRAPTQAAEALRYRITALFDTLFPPPLTVHRRPRKVRFRHRVPASPRGRVH